MAGSRAAKFVQIYLACARIVFDHHRSILRSLQSANLYHAGKDEELQPVNEKVHIGWHNSPRALPLSSRRVRFCIVV